MPTHIPCYTFITNTSSTTPPTGGMASTAVLFVLIITMGELMLTPLGSAGGSAGGELTPRRSPGGSSAGGELTPPRSGGGTASEFMPAGSAGGSATTTTAGVSALLRDELSLVDLGSNCSSDCLWCLASNIGSCLVHLFVCPDPLVVVQCFAGKFIFIVNCIGTGGSGSGEGQLTTTGSAGATASQLVPAGSAGGGSAATRTAHLSALLRNEFAAADVGIKCSADCIQCLAASILPCIVDGLLCYDPLELAVCFAGNLKIIVECFGT